MKEPSKSRDEPLAVKVLFSPANVWRIGLVIVALAALVTFLRFVLSDGADLITLVVLAWFGSLAMEPAVRRLSTRMRRGAAAFLVMMLFLTIVGAFLFLFGSLLVQQIALLVRALPDVVTSAVDWVNARFGTSYQISDILASINLTPQQAGQYAQDLLSSVLGLLGTAVVAVFGMFALLMLTFYLSADGPRLRAWITRLLPERFRFVFSNAWEVSVEKTGGYVAARLILATINSVASTVVFLLLGVPSWLALGVWTGVVAQFVPTIGTYISIALPAIVGLASPRPWVGLAVLGWGVLYQQVENLTLEPRISGWSVDIHPAVAFMAVILGASLFGVVGALLAVPVVAMLLSFVDSFTAHREQDRIAESGRASPPPGQAATDAATDAAARATTDSATNRAKRPADG